MKHSELTAIINQFGANHLITAAAEKYWQHHPTHSFCPTTENDWWMDVDGSVWTPMAASNPIIESELFFAHGRFFEICWNAGDVEAVFRDGQLVFSGHAEVDSVWNIMLSTLEYDSPDELAAELEACYRIGCNPLPTIRQRLKHLPLTVQFGIMNAQGGYWAEARSATLVVKLDDQTSQVGLELIDYYADNKAWYDIRRYEDVKIKDIL